MRRESFPVSGPIGFGVNLVSGEIRVETADTTEATVELQGLNEAGRKAVEEAKIDFSGDELKVDIGRKIGGVRIMIGRGPDVAATIKLPHDSRLRIQIVSAELVARGRYGEAEVNTVSGGVQVDDVEGAGTFKTISGDVEVRRIGGDASLNSVSGDVSVGELGGGARAKTISGDVGLDSCAGGSISAQSVSGDIRVGVRSGATVWMDVKSLSGKIGSEFEVGDQPPTGATSSALELRANSVSGDIRITRAA